ncbi:flagella cluster protein [Natrarchaeobius sp. A-rgal3]
MSIYDNMDGVRCPACTEIFERLVLIEGRSTSFPEHAGAPFCLVRRAEDIALFRH